MADDGFDGSTFDPQLTASPDLSPYDQLRVWAQDPNLAQFLARKAEEHVNNFTGAMPYASTTVSDDPYAAGGAPPSVYPQAQPSDAQNTPIVRTNPDGSIASNITTPNVIPPPAPVVPQGPAPKVALTLPSTPMRPPGDALNPPEDTTPEDKPKAEEKKKKASGADNSFTQMLAGLKALQPPPVNPVGTPSVRGPLASGAPNLSQLLQVMGAQTRPGVAETLGKLLVQGKA